MPLHFARMSDPNQTDVAPPAQELLFPTAWGSNCPPEDASLAEGVLFRRVLHTPVEPSDFLCWIELGRQVAGAERLCQAQGLSVFRYLARAYAERYPATGNLIARAELASEDGKLKPTPRDGNSHIMWWPFDGIDRCRKFQVI